MTPSTLVSESQINYHSYTLLILSDYTISEVFWFKPQTYASLYNPKCCILKVKPSTFYNLFPLKYSKYQTSHFTFTFLEWNETRRDESSMNFISKSRTTVCLFLPSPVFLCVYKSSIVGSTLPLKFRTDQLPLFLSPRNWTSTIVRKSEIFCPRFLI